MTVWTIVGFLVGVTIVGVIAAALMIITYEVSERRRQRESAQFWADALRKRGCSR